MSNDYSILFTWRYTEEANLLNKKYFHFEDKRYKTSIEMNEGLFEDAECKWRFKKINEDIRCKKQIKRIPTKDYITMLKNGHLNEVIQTLVNLLDAKQECYNKIINELDNILCHYLEYSLYKRDIKNIEIFLSYFQPSKTTNILMQTKLGNYCWSIIMEKIKIGDLFTHKIDYTKNEVNNILEEFYYSTIEKRINETNKIRIKNNYIDRTFNTRYKEACFYFSLQYELMLIYVIYLSYEEENINIEYYDDVLYVLSSCENSILAIFHDTSLFKKTIDLILTSKVFTNINNIKKLLKVNKKTNLFYYTSIDTMLYLFRDEDGKPKQNKMAIMNIEYMNDPSEGEIINNFLGITRNVEEIDPPHVYVKSFTPNEDFLPMWSLYGNKGEGCSLMVDYERLKHTKEANSLYKVVYIKYKGNELDFDCEHNKEIKENEFKDIYDSLNIIKTIYTKSSTIKKLIEKFVQEIAYLFKREEYSYEKETRILKLDYKYDTKYTKTEKPYIYLETDAPINFNEIMLGPKFESSKHSLAYIEDILHKATNGSDTPKIRKSTIKYR